MLLEILCESLLALDECGNDRTGAVIELTGKGVLSRGKLLQGRSMYV